MSRIGKTANVATMAQARKPPHVLTLVLLTAASVLSINMFLPSLPSIARDLGVGNTAASLALGAYLAVTAGILLALGPLSDRIGRRPVILGAVAVFVVASVGCALTSNFWLFLAFRVAQSAIACGAALSMTIVRDTRPQAEAASLIGYIASAMAIAPLAGPLVGGLVDAAFGWRGNFWIYAGLGGALLVLVWADLGETRNPDAPRPKSTVAALRELSGEPRFWGYALCSALSRGVFYIFVSGAPFVAVAAFGADPAEIGIYVGSITAGFMVGAFISGRLSRRAVPEWMMLSGRAVSAGGVLVGLVLLLTGFQTPLLYFAFTVFAGLGNGITIPSSNAAAMSVRPDLSGSAVGIEGALTVGLGAVLTTVTVSLLLPGFEAASLLVLMLVVSLSGVPAILWAWRLAPVADMRAKRATK